MDTVRHIIGILQDLPDPQDETTHARRTRADHLYAMALLLPSVPAGKLVDLLHGRAHIQITSQGMLLIDGPPDLSEEDPDA